MSELNSHIAWSCQEPSAIPLPGRGCRPHLHRAVPTARGNVPAVGGPGYCSHGIAVTPVSIKSGSCVCVPSLHGVVFTARGNRPPLQPHPPPPPPRSHPFLHLQKRPL